MTQQTKGELYRQLEEYTKNPFELVILNDVQMTIENMLDAAKAEFPRTIPTEDITSLESLETAILDNHKKILKWFKKYFGEV